jgi:hypothetical protein
VTSVEPSAAGQFVVDDLRALLGEDQAVGVRAEVVGEAEHPDVRRLLVLDLVGDRLDAGAGIGVEL